MKSWNLMVWTGKGYAQADGKSTIDARTTDEAIKKAGLYDPKFYTIKRLYRDRATIQIEVRNPDQAALDSHNLPSPADFVLQRIA